MTNLNDTLQMIAAQIHANPDELIAYANEDQLGGFHIDESKRLWPLGSLYAEEGQMLYALVRWLKPDSVVQIGGWAGASAAHLALAVKANGKGHVTSVDNGGDGNTEHGELLPKMLQAYVTLIWENGEDWLARQPNGSIGLMFEDASHATELVAKLTTLALEKVMSGGLLVNHDAAHDFAIVGGGQRINSTVGRAIRDGLAIANAYFRVYRADPSDCGIALTVIPGERKDIKVISKYELMGLDHNGSPMIKILEQFGGSNSAQGQGVISEIPQQIGNANIESVSEPPSVIEKKPVQKRKPRAKKA